MNMRYFMRLVSSLVACTLMVVLLAAAVATSQSTEDSVADYIAFDRLYIPALALTKQQQPQPARAAMKRLVSGWSTLSVRLASTHAEDRDCNRDLQEVGALIQKAGEQVASDQFSEAHETLEGVRGIFRELRKRHKIDYELDLLTDFHEPMEAIVSAVMGKTPTTLSDSDMEVLRRLTREAQMRWEPVKAVRFDAARYGLDATSQKRIEEFTRRESEILDSLQQELEGGDRSRVLAAANQIRSVFAQLYTTFGDFPRP